METIALKVLASVIIIFMVLTIWKVLKFVYRISLKIGKKILYFYKPELKDIYFLIKWIFKKFKKTPVNA